MSKKTVNVMAFGGGVKTTALLVAALEGDYHERPDFCVFGDPGWEHPDTYKAIQYYKDWAKKRGCEIITGKSGDIKKDSVTPGIRSPNLPLFSEDGTLLKSGELEDGRMLRQCTYEYKISVVGRETRKKLGYQKGQVVRDHHVNVWLGISLDESHRMKPSKVHWQTVKWPLIDMRWTRGTCVEYMKSKKLPVPPKSSCIGCPFHGNSTWRNLKKNRPDLWEEACEWDEKVRAAAPTKGIKSRVYLHRSLRPLREAPIEDETPDLFGEECEGYCGF